MGDTDDIYARGSILGRSYARDVLLGGDELDLNEKSLPWILNHIDCFDRQARLHESIREVRFYGYSGDDQDDKVWDKLGQAIGNPQALKKLHMCPNNGNDYDDEDDDDEDLPTFALEILIRILSQV
jgi:hypothetical protein